MNNLSKHIPHYFPLFFKRTYLYIMVGVLASLSIMLLHTESDLFVKEQMDALSRSTIQLCVSVALVLVLYQRDKSFKLMILVAPLLSSLTTSPLKVIGSSLSMLFFPTLSDPRLNEAMGFKKQYEARKQTLLPSIQTFIEEVLSYHIWCIQQCDYYDHKCVKVIREVLQLPIEPREVMPDIGAIKQLMRNYPEEVRLAIGEFVATIVEDAKSRSLAKKSTPIMFVGPPGTGKTYLAKELAALLQLPVERIDLSKYNNIYGTNYRSNHPEKGVIADLLIGVPNQGSNWSNKIVVLDEIDKALAMDENKNFVSKNGAEVYSFLHTLLEAQEVAIPLAHYDHASYDISQMKIILIANKTFTETLTEERAAALESRVKVIRFDQGFTLEKKQAIAMAYVDQLLTKKGIDRATLNQNVIDAIIAEDARIGLKGVRVLLSVIDQYIDALKYQKLINEISGSTMATFDVKQAYAPYHPVQLDNKKLPNQKA